jgi:hypothetical protein
MYSNADKIDGAKPELGMDGYGWISMRAKVYPYPDGFGRHSIHIHPAGYPWIPIHPWITVTCHQKLTLVVADDA